MSQVREQIVLLLMGRVTPTELRYWLDELWEKDLLWRSDDDEDRRIGDKVGSLLRSPHTLRILKRKLLPLVIVKQPRT